MQINLQSVRPIEEKERAVMLMLGRAMAQAVSRRPLTTEARVGARSVHVVGKVEVV
jgi:hypothetical protein